MPVTFALIATSSLTWLYPAMFLAGVLTVGAVQLLGQLPASRLPDPPARHRRELRGEHRRPVDRHLVRMGDRHVVGHAPTGRSHRPRSPTSRPPSRSSVTPSASFPASGCLSPRRRNPARLMAPPTDVAPASSPAHGAWTLDPHRLKCLQELERKVLWLAVWMIHHANHIRPKRDGLKVGGHQASSASVVTLMTALYFDVLRPSDRVAVKPHASPIFHAIQYLLGRQSRETLERFRALGGAQAYPSRTKDADDVDFSTGSVGLGVAMTSFAALVRTTCGAKGVGCRARRVGTDDRALRRRGVRRGQRLRGDARSRGSTTSGMSGGSSTTTARASTRSSPIVCSPGSTRLPRHGLAASSR